MRLCPKTVMVEPPSISSKKLVRGNSQQRIKETSSSDEDDFIFGQEVIIPAVGRDQGEQTDSTGENNASDIDSSNEEDSQSDGSSNEEDSQSDGNVEDAHEMEGFVRPSLRRSTRITRGVHTNIYYDPKSVLSQLEH